MWAVGDTIRQNEVHGTVTAVNGTYSVYYHLENGTCGQCLPHRLEKGFRMARPRKTDVEKKAAAAAKETNGLLEAVKFCAGGFTENGETYSTHALISGGYISTYTGIVMYGHKIDTAMQAAPHYGLLLKALKATDGAAVQITQLDAERLQIKQKGFRTTVPCLADYELVNRTAPDVPVGMLDSRMREAFEAIKKIASKRGEYVMESAILIGNGFLVACNNNIIGAYWHGLGFPEIVVPADFIEAVLKVPKSLVSFGFTQDQSVTFYFDDGSFIRSQLYAEKYPDWASVMPQAFDTCKQVPDNFYAALAKIEPFMDTYKTRSFVYMSEHNFHTDPTLDTGTVVECPGLLDAPAGIDVARVLTLASLATHIDYTDPKKMAFYGENFRGAVMTFAFVDKPHTPIKGAINPDYNPETFAHDEANGFRPPHSAGPIEYDPAEDTDAPPSGFSIPQA